jgi:hypothetical protein
MMSSITKRDNGIVPLTNQVSELWYGEIGVGNPEQKFMGKIFSTDFRE